MAIRFSKQRQASSGQAPRHSNPMPIQSAYSIGMLAEEISNLTEEIEHVKFLMADMLKQNADLKLHLSSTTDIDYFTIEDVNRLFDISPRLQQQDRSEGKLSYLKKKEGAKILYSKEHIQEYLSQQFEEYKSNLNKMQRQK
jgi:hypothetical protein